jgi:hypothetical protein
LQCPPVQAGHVVNTQGSRAVVVHEQQSPVQIEQLDAIRAGGDDTAASGLAFPESNVDGFALTDIGYHSRSAAIGICALAKLAAENVKPPDCAFRLLAEKLEVKRRSIIGCRIEDPAKRNPVVIGDGQKFEGSWRKWIKSKHRRRDGIAGQQAIPEIKLPCADTSAKEGCEESNLRQE